MRRGHICKLAQKPAKNSVHRLCYSRGEQREEGLWPANQYEAEHVFGQARRQNREETGQYNQKNR